MTVRRGIFVSVGFLLVALALALWLYPRLPAEVPTHWSLAGQVDGYMTRGWAAAFSPLMIALLAALAWAAPAISPRRFGVRTFERVFAGLMLSLQGLMLVVGAALLFGGAGYAVPVPTLAMLLAGVFFMILGNYMGKLRKNFFIGIRTPWTLASDAVWERTHRLGGWMFLLAGLLVVVATLAGAPPWLSIALLVAAALIPAVYSLVIYKRLPADE